MQSSRPNGPETHMASSSTRRGAAGARGGHRRAGPGIREVRKRCSGGGVLSLSCPGPNAPCTASIPSSTISLHTGSSGQECSKLVDLDKHEPDPLMRRVLFTEPVAHLRQLAKVLAATSAAQITCCAQAARPGPQHGRCPLPQAARTLPQSTLTSTLAHARCAHATPPQISDTEGSLARTFLSPAHRKAAAQVPAPSSAGAAGRAAASAFPAPTCPSLRTHTSQSSGQEHRSALTLAPPRALLACRSSRG